MHAVHNFLYKINFNIFLLTAREPKPVLTCPETETVRIISTGPRVSFSVIENVETADIPGYTTELAFSQETVMASLEDVGTAVIVTATANFTSGPQKGKQSQCSFMVHIVGKLEVTYAFQIGKPVYVTLRIIN